MDSTGKRGDGSILPDGIAWSWRRKIVRNMMTLGNFSGLMKGHPNRFLRQPPLRSVDASAYGSGQASISILEAILSSRLG